MRSLRILLQKPAARDDVGIVLVTEKLAGESEDIIREYVKSNARPLVTVIPDRHAGEKEVPGKW